jgi:hypothetical protein
MAATTAMISRHKVRTIRSPSISRPIFCASSEESGLPTSGADSFARQLNIPQFLFFPCIDPLSENNKELDDSVVQKVCDDFGIDPHGQSSPRFHASTG